MQIAEDTLSAKTKYWDLAKRIAPFVTRHMGLLLGLIVIVLIHTVIGRYLPTLFGKVVDEVIIGKQLGLLTKFCIIYFLLEALRFILSCTETYFFQVLGLKIIYDMRAKLFEHVQNLPVKFFDKNPIGRIITRLTNDFASLSDLFTAGLVSVFVDSISLIAIVVAMLLINVKLTLIVMALTPAMLWSCFYLSGKARDALRVIKKKLAAINSFVAENILGMKVTQLYAQEDRQILLFKSMSEDYKNEQLRNIGYLAWLHPVLNGFNAVTVAAALYYGGLLNQESAIPVGLLVAFLMHVQDFLPPLRNILEKYQTFQAALSSAERIFTLFDEPEDNLAGSVSIEKNLKGEIEFKNVTFEYSKENGPVLKNVSFKILPGQSIALVGATGSGKSTIAGLLQRFYDLPQQSAGQILVDGNDIRQIPKKDLRRQLGIVQQDFFLFRGTILSNITLNDPNISQDQALKSALAARCEKLIMQRGLEGAVHEKGTNLSTGEKQLLNFARILAFNPDILILDEATAHVDPESEAMIQKATLEATKGKTNIIIAHRLSTIDKCDRVFNVSHGVLTERPL